jgi:hypothetical protein
MLSSSVKADIEARLGSQMTRTESDRGIEPVRLYDRIKGGKDDNGISIACSC